METNLRRLAATIPEEQQPPAKKKKTAAGEKRPQRGLGVAKLEKLRLQDQLREMAKMENPADNPMSEDQIHGGNRLPQTFSPLFPLMRPCAGSARLGFQAQNQSIFPEQCRILRSDGAFSFSCSAVRHAVGSSSELPSNQISPLFERCGAYRRDDKLGKAKIFPTVSDLPLLEVVTESPAEQTVEDRRQRASEKRPLELFPCNSGRRSREDREDSSSASSRGSREPGVDLTLRLGRK